MAVDTQNKDLDGIEQVVRDTYITYSSTDSLKSAIIGDLPAIARIINIAIPRLIAELRAARKVVEAITLGYYDESPNPLCCACHNSPHTPDCPLAAYDALIEAQKYDRTEGTPYQHKPIGPNQNQVL